LLLNWVRLVARNQPCLIRYDAAALFHDVNDAKYATEAGYVPLSDFFSLHAVPPEVADLVHKIVENVSYSKERRRMQNGEQTEWHANCHELHWSVRQSRRASLTFDAASRMLTS
jgi:hypothetical protein